MKYLVISKAKSMVRADGGSYAVPIYREKGKKFGPITYSQNISVKRSILVTGAHDSGKTRWLTRLHSEARGIWGTKIKSEPLYLGGLDTLASWIERDFLSEWWDGYKQEKDKPWSKLRQFERFDLLPSYVEDQKAIMFIDDAHKLQGRKLKVARECAVKSSILVISASEEQRIAPNLRTVLLRRNPQIFRLNSDVAYDATNVLIWSMTFFFFVIGFWQAGIALGGLRALSSGRRSSRQD